MAKLLFSTVMADLKYYEEYFEEFRERTNGMKPQAFHIMFGYVVTISSDGYEVAGERLDSAPNTEKYKV